MKMGLSFFWRISLQGSVKYDYPNVTSGSGGLSDMLFPLPCVCWSDSFKGFFLLPKIINFHLPVTEVLWKLEAMFNFALEKKLYLQELETYYAEENTFSCFMLAYLMVFLHLKHKSKMWSLYLYEIVHGAQNMSRKILCSKDIALWLIQVICEYVGLWHVIVIKEMFV